jgi:protein-tyrosine phosphatase
MGGDRLQAEVEAWHSMGVRIIVSALEKKEILELELQEEENHCKTMGLEFFSYPIPDRGVPASIQSTADFLQPRLGQLREGKNLAIHCRAGIGRSSLLAACLLMMSGEADTKIAFRRISKARNCPVPDGKEQEEWVRQFARVFNNKDLD